MTPETNYDNFDISSLHNKFVKLIVVSKKNNEMFDRLLDKLYNKITVHELKDTRRLLRLKRQPSK